MDRWDRKTDFGCSSCMFYVPKIEHSSGADVPPATSVGAEEGRCRRQAPTMKGYPVVFSDDWCGEHKRGSNPIRDR
jgi:hypothetical protein